MTDGGVPGAGWYPDPWFTGQHRFWTGSAWTADVFPDGPDAGSAPVTLRPEGERPPAAAPTSRSPEPPPAPTFGYTAAKVPAVTAILEPWELLAAGPERPRRRWTARQLNVAALLVGLVVGFVVVAVALSDRGHRSQPSAAPVVPTPLPSAPLPGAPVPSAPVVPSDPDASVLQGLVVRQGDVPGANSVQMLVDGNLVSGQTTLDLCNGNYPSEALRTARLQVVEDAPDGSSLLSTEAVLYRDVAAAGRAMQEIRSVVGSCPNGPVISPVGEPTVTTHFGSPPDRSWPQVPSVQRQAYVFTTTDTFGVTDQRLAVYLRRGRVLEGLYFSTPTGAQPAVDGQTTIAGIVGVFAQRISALPTSVVGR